MKRRFLFQFFLCSLALGSSASQVYSRNTAQGEPLRQLSPDEVLQLPVRPADARLSYGHEALQFGDLRLPTGDGPFPVVMLVHGGCYANRLPGLDPRATSLDLLSPIAEALARSGIATWNIEFRRYGDTGGGWPGSFEDLSRATDFLRDIAIKYRLNLSHFVVAGHSSGGQLALWIAARRKVPRTSPLFVDQPLVPTGAIDIDGPPDPETFEPVETRYWGLPAVTQFLGGTPAEQPERYHDASALSFLPLGIPQDLVSAAFLQAAPAVVDRYRARAHDAGDKIITITLQGAGHFDMLAPSSPYWMILKAALTALLK